MGEIRGIPSAAEEEALLRAALAEEAPDEVDIERAWEAFSQRIAAPEAQRASGRGLRIRGRLVTLPAIAALLALAILLMGASYAFWAGPFRGYDGELQLIGQKHLYTTVNQSRTAGGLTITVTNVYADEGRTFIAYTIDPSAELRQRYDHTIVASYDLVDQAGHAPQGTTVGCTPLPKGGGLVYCLMDAPSFRATGDTLTLTWDIHLAYLLRSGSSQTDTDAAGWHFTFTVPYLHVNNGRSAFPQMCDAARDAGQNCK
jgi:hypothetical protein